MKDFDNIVEFNKYKEIRSQHRLSSNQFFWGKSDMQYLSKQKKETLESIPSEDLLTIKKFDSVNSRRQVPYVGYNELEVCVSIWSNHMEQTLLYALTSGTAYTIENGNIYIWYKPLKGYEGSGFYKLKRFVFSADGRKVKYFLYGDEKLSEPL